MEQQPSWCSEHILIVDDDDATRSLYRRALARAGLSTLEASSGFDALDRLHSRRIALVLLDSDMPGLTGMDVIEKIRRDARIAMVPVVMVTAADGLEAKVAGLQAGADDYLAKPVDLEELVARVHTQLRRSGTWQDAALASRRKASLIESLASMPHGASPAVTAAHVSALLQHELADSAIVVFGADGATVLSSRGVFETAWPAGVDLEPGRAAQLRERSERGPWAGPNIAPDEADPLADAACGVPLSRDGHVFGALLLQPTPGAGSGGNLAVMSAAGAVAPVISLLLAPALYR
jgi:DNA-binding response OmpR family regulator